MIKKLFFPFLLQETYVVDVCLNRLGEAIQTNIQQHMFLGVLNTVYLNTSNYLPHLELRDRPIQIVVVTNLDFISSVGIKRFDCI